MYLNSLFPPLQIYCKGGFSILIEQPYQETLQLKLAVASLCVSHSTQNQHELSAATFTHWLLSRPGHPVGKHLVFMPGSRLHHACSGILTRVPSYVV